MPDLKITAEADVQPAVKGLQDVQKSLLATSAAAKTVNPAMATVQQSLAKTAIASNALDSSLKKVVPGANQAGQALTNVGRVAQDLPFGFIGIQNNLNPLLESFQRLKAESGSTGGALKALGSSLIGPAGIGIALSLVSSAFVIFQNGIAGFNKKAKEAAESTDFLAKSLKDFGDETKENFGKEITSLNLLRQAIESTSVPMATRLQGIKDLKKEFPGLFDGLTNEQLLTGKVAGAYDLATAAILRKARASAAETQLTKIAAEKLKILEKGEIAFAEAQKRIDNAKKTKNAGSSQFNQGQSTFTSAEENRRVAREVSNIQQRAFQDQINALNKQQQFYLDIALKGADQTIKIEEKKVEKLKQVRVKAQKAEDDLILQALKRNAGRGVKGEEITITPVINVDPFIRKGVFEERLAKYLFDKEAFQKKVDEFNDLVNTSLSTIGSTALTNLGDAIAGALTGSPITGLFDSIFISVGDQIQQLGKFLIKSGIQIKAAKEAFKKLLASPIASIAVGIGLVALGALIKAAVNNKPKGFASGSRSTPGGVFDVGERGRERIFLPQGSRVQPNNEVTAYGGGNQVMIPDLRIDGSTFVIGFKRAEARMNRNGSVAQY